MWLPLQGATPEARKTLGEFALAIIKEMPAQHIIDGFKGTLDFFVTRGIPCVRRWPRYTPRTSTPAEKAHQDAFAYINKIYHTLPAIVIEAARETAAGTSYTARDIITKGYLKGLGL